MQLLGTQVPDTPALTQAAYREQFQGMSSLMPQCCSLRMLLALLLSGADPSQLCHCLPPTMLCTSADGSWSGWELESKSGENGVTWTGAPLSALWSAPWSAAAFTTLDALLQCCRQVEASVSGPQFCCGRCQSSWQHISSLCPRLGPIPVPRLTTNCRSDETLIETEHFIRDSSARQISCCDRCNLQSPFSIPTTGQILQCRQVRAGHHSLAAAGASAPSASPAATYMALMSTTTQHFCVLEDDTMHTGVSLKTATYQIICADQEKVRKCMMLAGHGAAQPDLRLTRLTIAGKHQPQDRLSGGRGKQAATVRSAEAPCQCICVYLE